MTTDPNQSSHSVETKTSNSNGPVPEPGAAASSSSTKNASGYLMLAGNWMKKSFHKAKAGTSHQIDKMQQRMTMEGLLKQALISLKTFLDPKFLKSEQKLIATLLRRAQGIIFLTEVKGGFLFGVKGGSGIILTRTDANAHININSKHKTQRVGVQKEWSAACAIGSGGISFGFQGGMTKIDHIIILPTEHHVDLFLGKGQIQLGGSASAVVANYGRNADVGVSAGGGGVTGKPKLAPILSYSFGVKGLFGGISLAGEIIKPRYRCNRAFYENKKITVKQILKSKPVPQKIVRNLDYQAIVTLLNQASGPGPRFKKVKDQDDNKNDADADAHT